MSKTKLTKRTASKLVGTGLKVKLAGQQGVGLFTNKDMRTQRLPLYEEAAPVTIKQKGSSVDNETLRMAVQELHPAKQRDFNFLPARGDVDRTSLLSIFRATAFCPLPFLSSCYTVFAAMNISASSSTKPKTTTSPSSSSTMSKQERSYAPPRRTAYAA
jgi:hypothetical protein